MRPFDHARATIARDAIELAAARPGAMFVAGGGDELSLWKDAACAPPAVIHISRLPLDAIELRDGEVAIGALARMADAADHPVIRTDHPVIRTDYPVIRPRRCSGSRRSRSRSPAAR